MPSASISSPASEPRFLLLRQQDVSASNPVRLISRLECDKASLSSCSQEALWQCLRFSPSIELSGGCALLRLLWAEFSSNGSRRARQGSGTDYDLISREPDVLAFMVEPQSKQGTDRHLLTDEEAMPRHVGNILSQLDWSRRTQVAPYALREGLTSLDDTRLMFQSLDTTFAVDGIYPR